MHAGETGGYHGNARRPEERTVGHPAAARTADGGFGCVAGSLESPAPIAGPTLEKIKTDRALITRTRS